MRGQTLSLLSLLFLIVSPVGCIAQDDAGSDKPSDEMVESEFPMVFSTDFEEADEVWEFADDCWKHKPNDDGTGVLSLFKKKGNYKPEVRSPFHQAILRGVTVSSFQFDCQVLSTHEDYPHRDAVLIFGYQSPTEFYYVHLGKVTDNHCNQIFIVNNEPRTKITQTTTDGTAWDDQWHDVRVKRDIETGEINVYFDDMETPVMTAVDKTFTSGRIGLGSFDDTADFNSVRLYGLEIEADEPDEIEADQ